MSHWEARRTVRRFKEASLNERSPAYQAGAAAGAEMGTRAGQEDAQRLADVVQKARYLHRLPVEEIVIIVSATLDPDARMEAVPRSRVPDHVRLPEKHGGHVAVLLPDGNCITVCPTVRGRA